MKTAQLATLYIFCLPGVMPISASAQPFVISNDGTEVTDQKTGLIWRRCSEGMIWNGFTCAGTASTFTHEAAMQHAATQAISAGVAWRLPNVKELPSIVDKNRYNPAIDTTAFPATPALPFWSASPYAGISTYAWRLNFYDGNVVGYYRINEYSVRLVRNGQ